VDKYQLFIDLDGVLVDFDAGVKRTIGREPAELHPRTMWPILAKTPGFYDSLGWMKDGRDLWNTLSPFDPVILTGLPLGRWAEPQKRSWCARELGGHIPVVTGMSRDKARLAVEWLEDNDRTDKTPVLVDDRLRLREDWEAAGGVFILHLTAGDTLRELKDLGYPV